MTDVLLFLTYFSLIGISLFCFLAVYGYIKNDKKTKTYIKYLAISLVVFIIAVVFVPDEEANDIEVVPTQMEISQVDVKEKELKEKKENTEKKNTEKKKEVDEVDNKKNDSTEGKSEESDTNNEQADENNGTSVEKEPQQKAKQENSKHVAVQLDRVVDGDTAYFIVDGVSENTRFLLIDTPETKSPNTCVQPYGAEASQRLNELLNSGQITIEYDGPKRDKYDRLLAHVFVDGISVQETLLEEGLARIAYIYDPPYNYMSLYEDAEQRAKSNGKNIWNNNGYATASGFTECVDGSASGNSKPTSSNSNGNNSSTPAVSGKKESFRNCTELKEVYPDGVGKDHPAYQDKMDRDKDDWACE